MSKPIADYALIGDGSTAALISGDGSIDWLCWPRFDSDALFAALLGTAKNGHWRIAPAASVIQQTRAYREDTMILDTIFTTESGTVRLTDFMPAGANAHSALVRVVTGLEGTVDMVWVLDLRFDYGSMPPWITRSTDGIIGTVGPSLVVLRTDAPCEATAEGARGRMRMSAGEVRTFTLQHGASYNEVPAPMDAGSAMVSTEAYWRDWISLHDRPNDWPAAIRRSLLTLKALIHAPTGGLIAAPTLGLPEQPGGRLNWDYRYCWLRDSTFTLTALMNANFHEEAGAWIAWLLRAIGGLPDKMRIVYRLDGARRLEEWEVPWLPGYEASRPVRVGNAAAEQRQLDVYGEVLDTLQMADRAGLHSSTHAIELARKLAEHVAKIWREPDQGMWESRDAPQHYVYSKCMAWVAIDRALKLPGALHGDARTRFETLRATMHHEICELGFDKRRNSFMQHYGSDQLDASLLLLPLVGFLPADNPLMMGTIAAIEEELMEEGLVRRQTASRHDAEEGAFIACSCWLVDCMALQGRRSEAKDLFERILALQNDVGLLAEEYHVPSRRLVGNFPQALSHLALVNTALGLCGPVLQRGGG